MLSRQIPLLRIIGIALGTGLVAFLIFDSIFASWILALVVATATAIFFAILGGLTLINITNRERYRYQMSLMRRKLRRPRRKRVQVKRRVVESSLEETTTQESKETEI